MAQADGLETVSQAIGELKTALEALPSSRKMSRADADAIYALAYNFVAQGHYESAFRYFSVLVLYNPTNAVYLNGLALTHKLLERFDEAITVYSMLAVFDPGNPAHTLAVAECQLLKRDYEEGRRSLDMVVRFCRERGGNDRVLARAEALAAILKPGAAPAAA
jgi:type III secretion system low calcium response chaperone LcrH/SycD